MAQFNVNCHCCVLFQCYYYHKPHLQKGSYFHQKYILIAKYGNDNKLIASTFATNNGM